MKSNFRTEILKAIAALTDVEKTQKSQEIEQKLTTVLAHETGQWVGFQSLKSEPQIEWSKVAPQIKWAFPVVKEETLIFKFNNQGLVKSNLGVAEPVEGQSIELNEIDGFVVPAVAYDHEGYRLGRGRGFYDRSLINFNRNKIGVCFALGFTEKVPREEHDLRCDKIITEHEVYQVRKFEGEQKWN